MPRLLIITRCHEPRGGADRIIADLAEHLPAHGWEVILGLTKGRQFNVPDRYVQIYRGLTTASIDGTLGTRSSRLRSLAKTLRRFRPDVVLNMRVLDAYEAVSLAKFRQPGLRLAVGLRSFEPPYLCDLKLYANSVDLCVTSGELLRAVSQKFAGLTRRETISIGGGVQPPRHIITPRQETAPLRILYCGRLDAEQKRVMDLVDLVQQLKQRSITFTLDIAGDGPARNALLTALDRCLPSSQLRFHGWLTREALYDSIYRQCDILFHCAAWEGMTIAPREAMAHGIVPVISKFTGLTIEGQFQHEVNALTYPVADMSAAAQCIERLALEQGLLFRLSANAMTSQSGRYSFDGAIIAWHESLSEVLNRPAKLATPPRLPIGNKGRLASVGLPGPMEDALRTLLRRPVHQRSPGSEWPTSTHLCTAADLEAIETIAQSCDRPPSGTITVGLDR